MTLPFRFELVHTVASVETEELASAFAVGALPPGEAAEYVRHLALCGPCRVLAAELQAVADALPSALEPRVASAGLKERVMRPMRAESADRQEPAEATRPATVLRWSMRRRWTAGLAVAASIVALAAAAVLWNLGLRSRNDDLQSQVNRLEQMLGAISSAGQVTKLQGTKDAPGASGTVVQSPSGALAYVFLMALPELPEGMVYQAWSIKGSDPVGVGLFSSKGLGEQLVVLDADFSGADAIGISIEPAGGSQTPTGAIVLLGASQG